MNALAERLHLLVGERDPAALPSLTDELVRSLDLPGGLGDRFTIGEVAQVTGVTEHTLRYYERIGLVEVDRAPSGHRVYDRHALGRVVFVTRLRLADLPIRDIRRYLGLVAAGDRTIPARRALLEEHREAMRQKLRDLQLALAVVDYKIATYGGACAPDTDHRSAIRKDPS